MIQGGHRPRPYPRFTKRITRAILPTWGPTCTKIAPSRIQAIGLNYFKLYPAPQHTGFPHGHRVHSTSE